MPPPSRVQLEFRLSLAPGAGRHSSLPDAVKFRLEKELRRRCEAMGLRVFSIRAERGKITMDVLMQGHMVKGNIERGLWGAINGIFKKEMPHMVKKGSKSPGGPSGFVF